MQWLAIIFVALLLIYIWPLTLSMVVGVTAYAFLRFDEEKPRWLLILAIVILIVAVVAIIFITRLYWIEDSEKVIAVVVAYITMVIAIVLFETAAA